MSSRDLEPITTPAHTTPFWQRAVLCLLATMLVTPLAVWHSFRHGRLLLYPYYDDVDYFNSGWEKLLALRNGGPLALAGSWANLPPHSPISCLLAMASFGVFGRHAWAPYVINALIVLFLFVSVDQLLGKHLHFWARVLILFTVAATRLPQQAVENFKPDLLWGFSLAIAAITILRKPLASASVLRCAGCGVLFALALLAKPTTFPLTTLILLVALGLSLLCDRYDNNWPGWELASKSAAFALATTLALSAMYYLFGGWMTVQYIYVNLFSPRRELWEYQGSRAQQLTYYLNGPGGLQMLGWNLYLFLALLLVGAILLIVYRTQVPWLRIVSVVLIALILYTVPSIQPVKNQFFGVAFQSMVILAGVMVLRATCLSLRRTFASAFLATASVASIALFCIPVHGQRNREAWSPENSEIVGHNHLVETIYAAIRTVRLQNPTQVLMATQEMLVNPGTLQWLAESDGASLNFVKEPQWNEANAEADALRMAHVVVVADGAGKRDAADTIKPAIEIRWYRKIAKDPGFHVLCEAVGGNGKTYRVYERNGL